MLKLTAATICGLSVLLGLAAAPAHSQDVGNLFKHPGKKHETKKDDQDQALDIKVDVPPYYGPKKRIAVADMEIKINQTQTVDPTPTGGTSTTTTIAPINPQILMDFGTGMTDMLNSALANTNRFILLERSDKGKADIAGEQGLAGVRDDTKAQAGQLLGAQYIVRGAITEFSYKKSSTGGSASFLPGINLGHGETSASVVLDIKLIDTSTGQIMDSVKADGSAKSKGTAFDLDLKGFKLNGGSSQNTPLGHATREAIEKAVKFICNRMDQVPWQGRVAKVIDEGKGPELYLNCGSAMGIKVGDELEVFHPGQVIEDPDTHVVLSTTKGARAGRCRVRQVEKNIAIATPIDGQGFADKDVVRFDAGYKPDAPPADAGAASTASTAPVGQPDPNGGAQPKP